jgi:hypothetical protein
MAKPGRHRALDEAKRRQVCAQVAAGSGLASAARYVGCSERTVFREAERNPEFKEQLRDAEMAGKNSPRHVPAGKSDTLFPELLGACRREMRRLGEDLLAIVRREVDDPIRRERIEMQFEAVLEYATQMARDAKTTSQEVREAMEYFDRKDRLRAEPDELDKLVVQLSEFASPIANNRPSDAADFDSFVTTRLSEWNAFRHRKQPTTPSNQGGNDVRP